MSVNDLKVSTGLQDAWGQEIFLGDLVVDVKTGGGARVPYVVTKTGAANNFRINNYTSSYTKSEHVIVVTDQYVKFKGQAEHEKLLDAHPIDLNPVKKKAPPMVWVVSKEVYLKTGIAPRYWVFNFAQETVASGNAERIAIRTNMGISTNTSTHDLYYSDSHAGRWFDAAFEFGYSAKPVSGKKLQEWGAKLGIDFIKFANQEITDPAVLAILNAIK